MTGLQWTARRSWHHIAHTPTGRYDAVLSNGSWRVYSLNRRIGIARSECEAKDIAQRVERVG